MRKFCANYLSQPRYQIRSTLCCVITAASIIPMLVGVAVLIVFILYIRLLDWIDQVVTSSILLNI